MSILLDNDKEHPVGQHNLNGPAYYSPSKEAVTGVPCRDSIEIGTVGGLRGDMVEVCVPLIIAPVSTENENSTGSSGKD